MSHAPTLAQDTRQRLLEAAIFVFAEKGFDGASIREIARKAQVNSALVQYYFGGKEGLYHTAIDFLFEHGGHSVRNLPPLPDPQAPDYRAKAIEGIRAHVRCFLGDLFTGYGGHWSEELHAACHLFWTREVTNPHPVRVERLIAHIRQYVDHLVPCLRALRPDLDEESIIRMDACIHAQILFYHRDMPTIALIRGHSYGPEDIDHLASHIADFSLRGLGIPEAFPSAHPQDASGV